MDNKFVFFVFAFWINITVAQTKLSLPIIGDIAPLPVVNVTNGPSQQLDLKLYGDRLLILDFWHTGCHSCIEAMPEINRMHNKFGSQLKIVPVTFEKRQNVELFWKNNKLTRDLEITSVVEDTLLKNLFPYKTFPHEVWIYKGRVISITSGLYLTDDNITRILSGNTSPMPLKYDFYNFDQTKRLFQYDSDLIDSTNTSIRYAAVCDFIDGINSGGGTGGHGLIRNRLDKTVRVYGLNQSIFDSFMQMFKEIFKSRKFLTPSKMISGNQILWKVDDRSRYQYFNENMNSWDWMLNNGICFETVYPDTGQTDNEVFNKSMKDLSMLFGLNVKLCKEIRKVYVIKRGPKPLNQNIDAKHSISISSLVYSFNQIEANPYLFDESGNDQILLPSNKQVLQSLKEIQGALDTVGLYLKIEDRFVNYLLFEEVNGGTTIDAEMQKSTKVKIAKSAKSGLPSFEEEKLFLQSLSKEEGIMKTKSGLKYTVLENGKGAKLKDKDILSIHYEGRYVNGNIFSSSYQNGHTVTYQIMLNNGGLSEILALMNSGDKYEVYVDPSFSKEQLLTFPDPKPANKPFIFTVKVVRLK